MTCIICNAVLVPAGSNWVDPPKRERKRHINYAENEYFRNALKTGAPRASGPRMPKMPNMLDFQFFESGRIQQLFEKQHAYELFNHDRKKEIAEREKVTASAASQRYSLFF